MTGTESWLWVGFTVFILVMLAVDLGIMQRRPHVIGMKEALTWLRVWTGLALLYTPAAVEAGYQWGINLFQGGTGEAR